MLEVQIFWILKHGVIGVLECHVWCCEHGFHVGCLNAIRNKHDFSSGSPFNNYYTEVGGKRYNIRWIATLYPWSVPYNAEC